MKRFLKYKSAANSLSNSRTEVSILAQQASSPSVKNVNLKPSGRGESGIGAPGSLRINKPKYGTVLSSIY
jgi:hypothetical protein